MDVQKSIHTTRSKKTDGNQTSLGSSHLLNSGNTAQSPQVSVRDPGELFLHPLNSLSSQVETVVGSMGGFRMETHGGIVGTSSFSLSAVGSRGVPVRFEKNVNSIRDWAKKKS